MQPICADCDKVKTYHKHIIVIPNTLPAHALSGCDTIGSYFRIEKPTVIKGLKNSPVSLTSIRELNSSLQLCETGSFMEAKRKDWKYRISQNNTSAPKLESLPPTNEVFLENLKRVHIQAAI